MILHQPRHALQRILSQTVYLESALSVPGQRQ
ncbi:hypothetical protein LTSEUGA_4613, partial [Salmonella enterica subsp. enterica serovar Uganda str. R8-3404]